jgi:O-antigen ligase
LSDEKALRMVEVGVVATRSPMAVFWVYWRKTALFAAIADFSAVLAAAALPWSTSLVAIFVLCWLGAVAWTMDYRIYLQSLKQPICLLPFTFFALAVVGTLWSDASWSARLHGIGSLVVVQNILGSLFNSHLFDVHEGWIYVLGVGVLGGMQLRTKIVRP